MNVSVVNLLDMNPYQKIVRRTSVNRIIKMRSVTKHGADFHESSWMTCLHSRSVSGGTATLKFPVPTLEDPSVDWKNHEEHLIHSLTLFLQATVTMLTIYLSISNRLRKVSIEVWSQLSNLRQCSYLPVSPDSPLFVSRGPFTLCKVQNWFMS